MTAEFLGSSHKLRAPGFGELFSPLRRSVGAGNHVVADVPIRLRVLASDRACSNNSDPHRKLFPNLMSLAATQNPHPPPHSTTEIKRQQESRRLVYSSPVRRYMVSGDGF